MNFAVRRRFFADFHNDWTNVVRRRLAALGVKVKPGIPDNHVRYGYFGLMRRRVTAKPRQVFASREFRCPPEVKYGLKKLRRKIEAGADITPHLSTSIERLITDALFDDWGIQHLHLGKNLDPKLGYRFVKRTGPLLYVYFTDRNAYFLDVMEHGEWGNVRLADIVHRNWPEVWERYRAQLNPPGGEPLSAGDVIKMRRAGVTMLVYTTDGTGYVTPGGGYMSDRTPTHALDADDTMLDRLDQLQRNVERQFDRFLERARQQGRALPPEPVTLRFDMGDENDRPMIVCDAVGFVYEFDWQIVPVWKG